MRFRMHGSCEGDFTLLSSSPGLTGRSSTPRLLDSITGVSGILGHPPARVTTTEYDLAFSRRIAPELCICFSPHKIRGRREGRVLAGTRDLVCNEQTKTHTSIQVSAATSGLPCAMVLRLITRSPWRRIPLASIADELTICRSPVGPENLRRLDTSHGCQNHTPLPSATAPVVLRAGIAHGKPALRFLITRPALSRPPQPSPTSVTIAIRPSCGPGWREF